MRLLPGIIAALCGAWGSSALAQDKPTLAILGLEVVGSGTHLDKTSVELARDITDELRQTARSAGPHALADQGSRTLQEMKVLSGCESATTECMAAIGRNLGVDFLIYGTVETLDKDGYRITIALLDVKDQTATSKTSKLSAKTAKSNKLLDRWSRKRYRELFGMPDIGDLALAANVEKGRVFIDGKPAGTLAGGASRIVDLPAGKRRLAVEAPGHRRLEKTVYVEAGETLELKIQLEAIALDSDAGDVERPKRPGQRGWRIAFWSATATGLIAGAAQIYADRRITDAEQGVSVAVDELSDEQRDMLGFFDACSAIASRTDPAFDDLKRHCNDGERYDRISKVNFGIIVASSALFVLAGYMGYLRGIPDQPRVRQVRLEPLLGPDSAGAQLTVPW